MEKVRRTLAEFLIAAAETQISEVEARYLLQETFRDYDVNFFTLKRTKEVLDTAFKAAGF